MSTLYELTTQYQALLDLGDSDDPEDQEAFRNTLEGLDYELDLKADDYAAVLMQLDGKAAIIDKEIERLSAIKTAITNNTNRMKQMLQWSMEQTGRTEIKTPLHTFKIQKNGGRAPLVVNEEEVPDSYKRVIVEIDRNKIREALEAGEELPFASIGERGSHLRIK